MAQALAVIALLLASTPEPAPESCDTIVRFDVDSGTATVKDRSGGVRALRDGDTLPPAPVCVEASPVSTSLYDLEIDDRLDDVTGLAAAVALVRGAPTGILAPLTGLQVVTERLAAASSKPRGEGAEAALLLELSRTAQRVAEAVTGEHGVEQVHAAALLTLARMGADPAATDRLRAQFRERLGPLLQQHDPALPARMGLVDELVGAYAALDEALQRALALQAAPGSLPSGAVDSVRDVLSGLPEVLDAARKAEAAAQLALASRATVREGPIEPSWGYAHRLAIRVAPTQAPELAGLARRPPATLTLSIAPRLPFRLSGGVVGLWVPKARFERWGAPSGVVEATEDVDQRALPAVSVGLVIPALESKRHRIALDLPEIVFAPITKTGPAAGVGVGASWRSARAGVGLLFMREEVLLSPAAGTTLPVGWQIRTESRLAGPLLYVSAGINLF